MKERLLLYFLPLLFLGLNAPAQIQNGDFEFWREKWVPHQVHYPDHWEINMMTVPMIQQPVDSIPGVSGLGVRILQIEEAGTEYLGITTTDGPIDYHPAFLSLDLQWFPTNDSTEALVYCYLKRYDTTVFDTTIKELAYAQLVLSDTVQGWTNYLLPIDYSLNTEGLQANFFVVYLLSCLDRDKTGMGSELRVDNVVFDGVLEMDEISKIEQAPDRVVIYDLRGRVLMEEDFQTYSKRGLEGRLSEGLFILEFRNKGRVVQRQKVFLN